MTGKPTWDEERIAEMLRAIPAAPASWVEAAVERPAIDEWVARIEARAAADEEFRRAVDEDLEAALRAAGIEPSPALVEAFRRRRDGR